jgi:hypothetical protein
MTGIQGLPLRVKYWLLAVIVVPSGARLVPN